MEFLPRGNKYTGYVDYEVQPEEVARMRAAGEEFTFLDCREPWEYQTAHIDDTKHIAMGEIPARIQELDPEERIVVLCHHGVRSMNVTAWLRQQGFEKAQSMAGGIDRWSRVVDSKVPTY
ncbi:MAG: sulfurtransferase [Acidobacteria bacterium]|nr:sulfurtransferase [Acidobacteriota bacterium]